MKTLLLETLQKPIKLRFFLAMESFIVLFNKTLTKREHQKNVFFFVFYCIVWKVRASLTNKESLEFFFLFDHTNHCKPRKHNLRSWNQNLQNVLFFWYLVFSRLAPPCHYSYLSDSQFYCPCRYRGTVPEKEGFC